MVDNLSSTYKELLRDHLIWGISVISALIMSVIMGLIFGPEVPDRILSSLYSSLITAVGSVLAIAFSVLFISTQIASDRYSSKFTIRFINDPIVKAGFGLGVLCIILNITVLGLSSSIYQILGITTNSGLFILFWGTGGFIVGLNIVFLMVLYPLIRLILIQTTPANIISQFQRRYSIDDYVDEAQEAEKHIAKHPMLPIYDLARNAIRREDYSAAAEACKALISLPQNYLSQTEGEFQPENDMIIEPVLSKYIRPLIIKADQKEQFDLVGIITGEIENLGEDALEMGQPSLHRRCFQFLHSDLLVEEGDRLNSTSITHLSASISELTYQTASTEDLFRDYVPSLSKFIVDLSKSHSNAAYEPVFSSLTDVYSSSVKQSESTLENLTISVLIGDVDELQPWERSDLDTPSPILASTYLLMQSTTTVLTTCNETPPGYLLESWEACIEEKHSSQLDEQLIHLLRRYIELLCYIDSEYNTGLSPSTRIVEISRREGIENLTIEACDAILSEQRTDSKLNSIVFLEKQVPSLWYPIPLTEYPNDLLEPVQETRNKLE